MRKLRLNRLRNLPGHTASKWLRCICTQTIGITVSMLFIRKLCFQCLECTNKGLSLTVGQTTLSRTSKNDINDQNNNIWLSKFKCMLGKII